MQMIFKMARTFLMFKDGLKVVNTPLQSYRQTKQMRVIRVLKH